MTLEERVKIVVDMCNREIKRQETFMACAEKHDNDKDWIKHYELQGLYMNVKDILEGDYYTEIETNNEANTDILSGKGLKPLAKDYSTSSGIREYP